MSAKENKIDFGFQVDVQVDVHGRVELADCDFMGSCDQSAGTY